MKRIFVRFKNGETINLMGDCIDLRDGKVLAWNGDGLIMIADETEVAECHLTQKQERG